MKNLLALIWSIFLTACVSNNSAIDQNPITDIEKSELSQYDAIVDKTDPEAHLTISMALSSAPVYSKKPYKIFIAAGDYYEKVVVDKPNIHFVGQGQDSTRLYHDTYAGQRKPSSDPGSETVWTTWESATLTIKAENFVVQDMHIENSFNYPANAHLDKNDPRKVRGVQAVAVMTDIGSDKSLFDKVTFSGYQDTFFALAGRSLVRDSIVKGHVDFIFGAGTAVFLESDIVTRARAGAKKPIGYITAPSTNINSAYGLIFINSRLLRETGVMDNSMALGRPWHPTTVFSDGRYADPNAIGQAIYINCWMDSHIQEAPWHAMGGTAPDGSRMFFQAENARFYEFNSSGPGAGKHFSRRQLTKDQVQGFTLDKILDGWVMSNVQ